jgi:hypothetical protein
VLLVVLLLVPALAGAQRSTKPFHVLDEGTQPLPGATGVNFVGAGVSCAPTPPYATCTIPGGGSPVFDLSQQVGVDCTGASDSRTGVTNAFVAAKGGTVLVPSGCVPRFGSPGAGNAAVSVPSKIHVLCQDKTAGFAVVRQRCTGGTYPFAACSTSTECLGGGTCDYDFGSSIFAPTAGTFTIFKDAIGSADIWFENCTIWTYQADSYQRCTGTGGNSGDPCRQECDGDSTFKGARCENGTGCPGGGSCLRVGDCGAAGGTGGCGGAPCCAGAPKSASSSGKAKINVFDFANTVGAKFTNVEVKDHFVGAFTIKAAAGASLQDVNTAGEISNCTTPYGNTPAGTGCLVSLQGTCCYGAANKGGAGTNVQPTVAVTNGIVVGWGSTLARVSARGSTTAVLADTSINGGLEVRVDNATVVPTTSSGPGTASAGINVAERGMVSGSFVQYLASGAYGITMSGAAAKAMFNTVAGVNGAGRGISSTGDDSVIEGNTITGDAATGAGIVSSGNNADIHGNRVISSPNDTLQDGIVVSGGGDTTVSNNKVHRVHDSAYVHSAKLARGNSFINNKSQLVQAPPTASLQPVHYLLSGGLGGQTTLMSNYMEGGWRGVTAGPARADGLLNVNVVANRFVGLAGAPMAASGAGALAQMNYANANRSSGSLVCDATCIGGNKAGAVCFQDSDCTGCNAAVKPCIPEPLFGYLGSPYSVVTKVYGASHQSFVGNLMFDGIRPSAIKQCTGMTTYPGSQCTTAGNTCAGGAPTCTGGPPAVCGGTTTEAGNLCCPGSSPVCAARTDTPFVRAVDPGGPTLYRDVVFAGNHIFGGEANAAALDMQSSAGLGNIRLLNNRFTGNMIQLSGVGAGIRFPVTVAEGTANNTVDANSFSTGTDVENWAGTYGSLSYTPMTISLTSNQVTNSGTFIDVKGGSGPALAVAVKANRSYFFTCQLTFSSAATTTGVAFAMTGPPSPTTFAYIARLPTATKVSNAGTDAMREEEGNADDDTATPSLGVGRVGTTYMASVQGNLVTGAHAGNLTARVKAENTAADVTVYAGSNCVVTQVQ